MVFVVWLACAGVSPPAETDGVDVDPCVDLGADDPCCQEPAPLLWACATGMWGAASFTGTFARDTGPSDPDHQIWFFQATDGSIYDIRFLDRDVLPDLAAFGEVTLIPYGGCESDGEGASMGTFSVFSASGKLLFAVGATNTAQVGSITVTHGEADDVCPNRPSDGCFPQVRNHAVVFSDGSSSVRLFQGESATLNGATIHLNLAMLPEGEVQCDDVSGNLANWVILGAP